MFRSADKLSAPEIGDAGLEGAQLRFMRVICQAVEDHGRSPWRNEVDAFFSGPTFARYCATLGWNADWARHRIRRFCRQAVRTGAPPTGRDPKTNTRLDSNVASKLAS